MFRGKNYKESAKLIDKQTQYEPLELNAYIGNIRGTGGSLAAQRKIIGIVEQLGMIRRYCCKITLHI